MDFPLSELMDEHACYARLVGLLHPDGLACPRCGAADRLGVHRCHRDPVLDYQCGHCRRVFNAFTGTPLSGTRRSPSQLLLIFHGVAQAAPTARMARELECDRKHLLELRHRLQGNAALRLGPWKIRPLPQPPWYEAALVLGGVCLTCLTYLALRIRAVEIVR